LGLSPTPGEPVPLELHDLLRSDFSSFEIGEYVAVQQLSDDQKNDDDQLHYCYAIFRRNDPNPDVESRFYGLQLTEDEDDIEEVPAHLVFKFERGFLSDDVSQSDFFFDFKDKSYDKIVSEIQNIFKRMVTQSEKTRKLIIRRLYLAWHPDKHPESTQELATKVFQFIQKLIKDLRDGNINFDDLDRQARSSYSRYWDYRNRFKQSRQRHGHTYFSHYFYSHPTFRPLNPQPYEAYRWLRQASYDIEAADEITKSHEWACYIAHQVWIFAIFYTL